MELLVIAANFTSCVRLGYKVGVPYEGEYEVILHSNSTEFGGSRKINKMVYHTQKLQFSDMDYTLSVPIDGNSAMILKRKIVKK